MDDDELKCLNLKKNNDESLIKKDYNFLDLNNELKKNLLNINDIVKIPKIFFILLLILQIYFFNY